jgi:hypothetical protein
MSASVRPIPVVSVFLRIPYRPERTCTIMERAQVRFLPGEFEPLLAAGNEAPFAPRPFAEVVPRVGDPHGHDRLAGLEWERRGSERNLDPELAEVSVESRDGVGQPPLGTGAGTVHKDGELAFSRSVEARAFECDPKLVGESAQDCLSVHAAQGLEVSAQIEDRECLRSTGRLD